jgi:hypothetical protein
MNDARFAEILERQFDAALTMMRNAILACPEERWTRRGEGEASFWQHALHVLFYTRLYCFESLDAARESGNGRHVMAMIGAPLKDDSPAELQRMASTIGYTGMTEENFSTPAVPTRAQVLEYLEMTVATCHRAMEQIAAPAAADSVNPMPWMKGTRGELLLYNLRHVNLHLGRLHSMLGREGIRVNWIGGIPQG